MAKKTSSKTTRPLDGRVALVAGATRGAGRGIAHALGEAGATVYCTGRSVKGKPSAYKRPETIDETAAMIKATGGDAIAVRVDHTVESEVKKLFARILRDHKRIDIVVNSVAGEHPLMKKWGSMWQADTRDADEIFKQALTSHLITAKHAALAMMPPRNAAVSARGSGPTNQRRFVASQSDATFRQTLRGLIVEITENDILGGGGNPMAQVVKVAQKVLPLFWAPELKPHGIAVMSVTPGFLRSEAMLQGFGVTEENWRDAGKKDSNFLVSESPLYVGRAVAALAADPNVMDRTGMLWSSWELAGDYKFTDYDGRRPDWGRHTIDWSGMPPEWIDLFRTGTELGITFDALLRARTKKFLAKIPQSSAKQ